MDANSGGTAVSSETLKNAARWEFLIASLIKGSPENLVMEAIADNLFYAQEAQEARAVTFVDIVDAGTAQIAEKCK